MKVFVAILAFTVLVVIGADAEGTVGTKKVSQTDVLAALQKITDNKSAAKPAAPAAVKVQLTNKEPSTKTERDDENNDDEIHLLATQLADWCGRSGRCNLDENGLLKMKPSDRDGDSEVEVDDENAVDKRGVGAVNDLCKLYRVKCKRQFPPFMNELGSNEDNAEADKRSANSLSDMCKLYGWRCKRDENNEDFESPGDHDAKINKRPASSIGDMCRLYGAGKCRRTADEETPAGDDGTIDLNADENKLYLETVRNFLKLCNRYKECDFNLFVGKLATRVQNVLERELNAQLDDCVKSGLCKKKPTNNNKKPAKSTKKQQPPRELMMKGGDDDRVIIE